MIGITIVGVILLLILAAVLFINLSPEFGASPSAAQKVHYAQENNYKDGKFINPIPTDMSMGFGAFMSVLGDYIKGSPGGRPDFELPVESIDSMAIINKPSVTRLTWFGHSTFLLEIDGKNILIDPMLGNAPAPHPWLGGSRFSKKLPITIDKIPAIDAIILSHDHYDHLDYGSIMQLKDKVSKFYVPLGVSAHLIAWGIPETAIHELNWWEEIEHDGMKLVFTPSRHFSGRGLTDRFHTLWGSWIITGSNDNIYFSGDSGYGPHFKEIGEKYGPFNFSMIECGQYDERWGNIHMMPEESAQAGIDLRAKLIMPIHWGAFRLALHSWTDPIERVVAKAYALGLPITTPKIGEPIILDIATKPHTTWWKQ